MRILILSLLLALSACSAISPTELPSEARAKPDLNKVEDTEASDQEAVSAKRDLGRHGRSTFSRQQLLKDN
jgi:hypothetical protein